MKDLFRNVAHSAAQSGQVPEMRRPEPHWPRLTPATVRNNGSGEEGIWRRKRAESPDPQRKH